MGSSPVVSPGGFLVVGPGPRAWPGAIVVHGLSCPHGMGALSPDFRHNPCLSASRLGSPQLLDHTWQVQQLKFNAMSLNWILFFLALSQNHLIYN